MLAPLLLLAFLVLIAKICNHAVAGVPLVPYVLAVVGLPTIAGIPGVVGVPAVASIPVVAGVVVAGIPADPGIHTV